MDTDGLKELNQFLGSFDILMKICVVGDASVGKTAIAQRYVEDKFDDKYYATIGVEFVGSMKFKYHRNLNKFKLEKHECGFKFGKYRRTEIKQPRDTAGQERFRAVTSAYYRGCQGIILVFDITSQTSFANLDNWVKTIEKTAEVNSFVLVGNKADLSANRTVDSHIASEYAAKKGWKYIEASAKNSTNVESIFYELALLHHKNNPPEQGEPQKLPNAQTVFVSRDPKGKSCC